ncbi:hypothetical protein GCM10011409_45400 [Lentibacillus populi]|uniref:Uncharacterized protein n=1 Tax=Lentibacillus populi TaxID=1827502 RepID=A0A9W5U232_9BACI|nr:hypothetical protein [Lentibacillus populi]GGB63229.1 hypothetical protein GCM10011409_45400 [Lentibacillus populi]
MQKRYIRKPSDVRKLLSEQLNILREMKAKTNEDKIKRAKAIAYISSISLYAMRDGDLEERLKILEDSLKNE